MPALPVNVAATVTITERGWRGSFFALVRC
jgi:hypothetical protein